jgi:RNA polymerase sigma-70 factor (ECF subfamily)
LAHAQQDIAGVAEISPSERAMLVRLCARLTGCPDAAEDLAQETLLEAWRSASRLREPERRAQWLCGIARNVCLRWSRGRGRELSRLVAPSPHSQGATPPVEEEAESFDLELELERDELAALLDRAMAMLPPHLRSVLVERYVEESPQTEIAARLGLSEGAVSLQLKQGRLRLKRLLSTELREHAEAYGLYDAASDGWRETRVWCPRCGARTLVARLGTSADDTVAFRCPGCDPDPRQIASAFRLGNRHFRRLIGAGDRPRAILGRAAAWSHDYYRAGLEEGVVACTHCGRPTSLGRSDSDDAPPEVLRQPGVYARCEGCGEIVTASSGSLVEALPEVRRFQREHPRLRALPVREIEAGGRPAVVARFESVAGGALMEVVSDRETFRVLEVRGPASCFETS